MPIQCDIVTQERSVFSQEVDYVSLPGSEGVMGILPNHAPMLTALAFGEVMVRDQSDEHFFAIGGGYAEVQPDRVIILADSAENAGEIDLERAEKARKRAEQDMKQGGPTDDTARYAQIEMALKRAQIRINVGKRRSTRRRRSQLGVPELGSEEEN
jgi:F-type H+-transporting ATPase subunit epsilon